MNPTDVPPPIFPSTPPPVSSPIPPSIQSPSDETVFLVIDKVIQKTGIFSKQVFRLLVTNMRLIFVLQVKNSVDYLHQNTNLSLAENPANFAIPLEQLQGIEVYRGGFEDSTPDSMTVRTYAEKMTFLIPDAYRVSQNLKKVLGNKVK